MEQEKNIKYYLNKYLKGTITLLVGVTLMALGGAVLVVAGYGSDSLMVYNQGLATTLKISIGTAIIISNCLAFVIVLIINRKLIGLGTFVIAFLLGPLVNLFISLDFIPTFTSIYLNIILVLVAFLIACLGTTLYIYSNVGLSPFEAILITIKDKKKYRFAYIKIVNDAIFFLIGYFLGGVFGFASILTVIVYGPLIDLFTVILEKLNIITINKPKEEATEEKSKKNELLS